MFVQSQRELESRSERGEGLRVGRSGRLHGLGRHGLRGSLEKFADLWQEAGKLIFPARNPSDGSCCELRVSALQGGGR